MFPINHDDPLSTSAAALALADALLPDLLAVITGLSGGGAAFEGSSLSERMAGACLFESQTVTSLRGLIAEAEAGVQRETAQVVTWAPVRHIAGVEEFEPVTASRRTPRGDKLVDLAGRLCKLVALVERTETLLAAERALACRRQGREGRSSPP